MKMVSHVNISSLQQLIVWEHRAKKEIEYQELMFLLTGGVSLKSAEKNPDPDWLQDKSWEEICRASELPVFHGLR